MKAIDVAGFEGKFRENIDPWDYTNSRFEHFKRNVLLRACGHGKHGRALELGCAIGETTRLSCALMPSAGGARWLADSPSRGEKAGTQRSCEICPGEDFLAKCPEVLSTLSLFLRSLTI